MTDHFTPAPEGSLSERIDLPDLRVTFGLMHVEGAGLRVVRWDGQGYGHMSAARARRTARELAASDAAEELKPAIEALDLLSDRVDAIMARVAAERAPRLHGEAA